MQTCGTILALAYVLRHLSAVWLQHREKSEMEVSADFVCHH